MGRMCLTLDVSTPHPLSAICLLNSAERAPRTWNRQESNMLAILKLALLLGRARFELGLS